jgi:hypothetical protein
MPKPAVIKSSAFLPLPVAKIWHIARARHWAALMKKESAALFEHAEEFNFTAHVSLSELKSSKPRKS